ncbi:MAG: DUF2284 domain-containing protein [Oscillospiraceae bacterium]
MLCAACTRPAGRPCRHPEAVGYSLESLGCDVGPPPGESWAGSCCGPGGISCRDT